MNSLPQLFLTSTVSAAVTLQVKQYSLFWFETTEGETDYLVSKRQESRKVSVRALGSAEHKVMKKKLADGNNRHKYIYGIHTVTRKQSLFTQFYFP